MFLENYEKLKRPVTAFVTFTTQEAKDRAVENYATKKDKLKNVLYKAEAFKLFGQSIPLLPATEATNLVWENLAIPDIIILRNRLSV